MVDLNKIGNTNLGKLQKLLNECLDEVYSISLDSCDYDSFGDYATEFMNRRNMIRDIFEIEYRVNLIYSFFFLILVMETDKDKFEVQKILNNFFELFIEDIDRLIKSARTTKFNDYRLIDWERRVAILLVEIKQHLC